MQNSKDTHMAINNNLQVSCVNVARDSFNLIGLEYFGQKVTTLHRQTYYNYKFFTSTHTSTSKIVF